MAPDIRALIGFIQRHPRLVVLTGAGCSTESGIPDYRDEDGQWKRPVPMTYQAFTREHAARQRYWARSMIGWPRIAASRPGPAHAALARLEGTGHVRLLITQNVDGLHQAAGSQRVVDLHGRLDAVRCLACGARRARGEMQQLLQERNADWLPSRMGAAVATAPDGDAYLDGLDFSGFQVPSCPACGDGLLKPDVVFFGEGVPRPRVDAAMAALHAADALLVVGSSLMVYSGYRFARAAAELGMPIAAVNLGRTRADELLALKVSQSVGAVLVALVDALG